MMTKTRFIALVAALAVVAACDERVGGLTGGIRRPPVDVTAGDFDLREVDDDPLPHSTTNGGTVYSLVSGTLAIHDDSTWIYSSLESLSGTNGTPIGQSPANYTGSWKVTDSTMTLLPNYGTIKLKGDSLFWTGGPKHTWEDTLKFTLVRK